MRRFTIQDLQRPNQQYESRVGDDFEPLVVRAPNLPAVPDLMKIADATSRYMDRKEAHDEQAIQLAAKAWDAENSDKADAMRDRLLSAGDGKEGDDIEKAWISETRKMVEEGLLPANANIAWVRTIADLEAQRVKGQLGRDLEAEAYRLGQILDENGDRTQPEDAEASFERLYAEALENPLFDQSETALRSMLRGGENMRQEFIEQVYSVRTERERLRGDSVVSQAFLSTVAVGETPIFGGISGLGSPALQGAGRLAEVDNAGKAIRFYRDESGVPNAEELFVNTAFSHARALVASGNATEAKTMLTSIADVRVNPDLRLEEDARFAEDFALAFKAADQAERTEGDRMAEKRRRFNTDAEVQFSYYYNTARKTMDSASALRAATLEFRKSDGYSQMLEDAGFNSEPEYMAGLFSGRADAIERSAMTTTRDDSKRAAAEHQLNLLLGVDRQTVLDQVDADERLHPSDKLSFFEDPTAERWGEWREHQESALNDDFIASANRIDGASNEVSARLKEAEIKLRRAQGRMIGSSSEDFETVTASQEWTRALEEFQTASDTAKREVAEAQKAISGAISRGDWTAVESAAEAAGGLLRPDYLKAERDRARQRETSLYREVLEGPLAREGKEQVAKMIETMNIAAQIEDGDQAALVSQSRYDYLYEKRLLEKDLEIRQLDPAVQRERRRTMYQEVVDEIRDEVLAPEEQAAQTAVKAEALPKVQAFYRDRETIKGLSLGQPWSQVSSDNAFTLDAMDSPRSTSPFLEFVTKPSTSARRLEQEVGVTFAAGATAGNYDEYEKTFVRHALTTGVVTPANALDGKIPLRFTQTNLPPAQIELLESKGWTVTPGKTTTDRDGTLTTAPTIYEKTVEAEVSPYTTLYFRGTTKASGHDLLDRWLRETPDAERETFYRFSGRAVENLKAADRDFERHQRVLLDRLTK